MPIIVQAHEMPRRPYKPRQWIYNCPVCHQWQPVANRTLQTVCREAGACPTCVRDEYWLLRVRIVAIETHIEELARNGKDAPEHRKPFLREVYNRKARMLAQARAQLAALTKERTP